MQATASLGRDHFTTGQIAKLCRVAPRTVSKWTDSGMLAHYRIPGSLDRRVTRSNLIRFLKEHGMPLYDLETAGQFHLVTVGLEKLLQDKLADLLPEFFWKHPTSGFELGLLLGDSFMDAMVIDLAGNRGEGLHVLRRLRTMSEYARLEIIGLTSEDETEMMADLMDAGFNAVYRRPFDVTQLANWLRSLARMKWGLEPKRGGAAIPPSPKASAMGRKAGLASAAARKARVA